MIVVTTPTGTIGRQVLRRVLDSNETVRVIARDPARLPEGLRQRVEVHEGSHGDIDVVDQAFAGADAVFWLPPPNPAADSVVGAYVDFSRPACDAVKRHGVNRVVGVSALGRGFTRNAGLVSASLAMDDLFADTGASYRALTMPSFMDNILRQAAAIKDRGMFFSPVDGDRKLPTCATRDIAAVAATLLLDHSWSGVDDVPILGPEDLSFNDMALIMSQALGKSVRYKQVPFDTYRTTLVEQGWSAAMAQGMVEMMMAKDRGLDNAEPRTPQATTPTTFRQWCEEVLKPAVSKEIS